MSRGDADGTDAGALEGAAVTMKRRDFIKATVSLAAFGPDVLSSLVPAPEFPGCHLAIKCPGYAHDLETVQIGWDPNLPTRVRRLRIQSDLCDTRLHHIEALLLVSHSGRVLRRNKCVQGTYAGFRDIWTFNYTLDLDLSDIQPSRREALLHKFFS